MTIKDIYKVNEVVKGYEYYLHLLEEKSLGMFIYSNCPDSLPPEQIESRLIYEGRAIVFKHKTAGIVTVSGGLSGIDKYYLPTHAVYAQPALGSGNLLIGKDCIIIYNSQIDQYRNKGLYEIITRYARMLADADSSIQIALVNSRAQKMVTAATMTAAESINKVLEKMKMGDYESINQQSIIDMYKILDMYDTKNNIITELLSAKEKILSSFLSEIGVKNTYEKKERLISDELSTNEQLLTVNTDDLLTWRKKGIELVNKMFGTSITVKRNPVYSVDYVEKKEQNI